MSYYYKVIIALIGSLCFISIPPLMAGTSGDRGLQEAALPPIVFSPGTGNILYVNQSVDQTAAGYTGSGDSWANAIPELADALKWANDNKAENLWDANNPLKIYVAKGTYRPMYSPEDGAKYGTDQGRDNTFLMVKNVELYGGFDPANGVTELTHARILPDKNGANLNGTILSGDLDGNDVIGSTPGQGTAPISGNEENVYHVVLAASATEDVVVKLDGIAVTGGHADGSFGLQVNGSNVSRKSGGGIYSNFSSSSSVQLTNSSVYNNSSSESGGGIYSYSYSSSCIVTLGNSSVHNNNSGGSGGGIYSYSYSPSYTSSSVVLSNSSIYNNCSAYDGGGIYSSPSPSPSSSNKITLINSTLAGNIGRTYIYFGAGASGVKRFTAHNSILYGNVKSETDNSNSVLGTITGTISKDIQFSLVQGENSTVDGNLNGTLAYANLFTDATNGDYSLAMASPAIDAGKNALYSGDIDNDTDLAGRPRLFGATIDMGAYEYQGVQYTPDVDNILYVNQSVNGGNGSGDSWANAIPELADALKWANDNKAANLWDANNPLKIYVAKGTYKPKYTPEDGKGFSADAQYARDRTFLMVKNVELYGGFDPASGVTELTHVRILPDKDRANPIGTILSGDLDGNDVVGTMPGQGAAPISSNEENVYHVVMAASATEDVVVKLDGFNITGGNASGSSNFQVNGVSVFRGYGSGICSVSYSSYSISSSIALTNSSVYNNSSSYGGGVYSNSHYTSSSVLLTNSSVYNNISSNNGGGVFSFSSFYSSSIVLTNSSVYNNSGSNGGGIYSNSYSTFSSNEITLINSTIAGNIGGAYIHFDGNGAKKFTANNSILYGNLISETDNSNSVLGTNTGIISKDIQFSLVQGENSTVDGNLDGTLAYPDLFTDATNGDYSLAMGSPAIDAGNNALYSGDIDNDTDLAGNPRLFGATIDMGAYEYQSVQYIPDADNILYVDQSVDQNAAGYTGVGDSWANAISELADALKWANDNKATNLWDANNPLKIYVAKGTYKPKYSPEEGPNYGTDQGRDNTFLMVENVHLYGGFVGVESNLTERVLSAIGETGTILSGDFGENDIVSGVGGSLSIENNDENAYHVVMASGRDEDLNVFLDGFEITGGNANGSGAIWVNTAVSRNTGGGFYLSTSGNITLTLNNSRIIGNSTDSEGGGIYSYAYAPLAISESPRSEMILKNVHVIQNYAIGNGGGIYSKSYYSPNNSTKTSASGIIFEHGAVSGNYSGGFGGGIFSDAFTNATAGASSSLNISLVRVSENHSNLQGGGIFSGADGGYSRMDIYNAELTKNTAKNDGAAISTSAPFGTNHENTIALHSCTVVGNRGNSYIAYNGGKRNFNVRNSVVLDNRKANNSNSSLIGTPVKNIGYSLIQGETSTAAGVTIGQVFTDSANGDYSLADNSPAIDAGSNTLYQGDLANDLDLAGNPRLYNNTIDMGAYEYQGVQYTPDANNILYVDQSVDQTAAGYTGLGDSWANAIPELADALKWARENHEADNNWLQNDSLQIYVAKGTYLPKYKLADVDDQNTPTTDRDKSFLLVNNVQLYGGFDPANGITDLSHERIIPSVDSALGEGTVLSGDLAGNDEANIPIVQLKDHHSRKDNAYHVVVAVGHTDGAEVKLDGFTISGGNANVMSKVQVEGLIIDRNYGGGIYFHSLKPVRLINSRVNGNSTSHYGGGFHVSSVAVNLMNSTVSGNYSGFYAGGICAVGTNLSVTMINSALIGNFAQQYGSGIYTRVLSGLNEISLNSSTFAGNTGISYIYFDGAGSNNFTAYNSVVYGNVGSTGNSQSGLRAHSLNIVKNIKFSLVQGENSTADGNLDGTIVYNDLFTDAAGGDYSLTACSPAVNAGSNSLLTGLDTDSKDVAGNLRVYDSAGGGIIDMGAYEFQGEKITYDNVLFEDKEVTYNGSAHTITAINLPASVHDSYVITDVEGTVVTEAMNAGVYTVTVTLSGCGPDKTLTAALTIEKALLTITADANQNKVYGDSDPEFTYTVSGYRGTDDDSILSGALSRVVGEDVGGYPIEQGDLSAGANYEIDFTGADFSITKATLTITAEANQSKVYGEAEPILTYTASGYQGADDDSILTGALSRVVGESVGAYAIGQGDLSAGVNYDIVFVSADFAITKALLTITAEANQSKVYGEAEPILTYTASGYQGADDPTILTGALDRATGEDVGTYAIGRGDLSAGVNYDIVFVSADFAITKATLTITADANQSKVYGDTDPVLTYTVSGYQGADDNSILSGALSRVVGESVGAYLIGQGDLSAGANYDIDFTGADFTITKATLTITAEANQSKVYGDADPVLTYTVSGYQGADDNNILTGALSRVVGEDVGAYAIGQGDLSAGANYDIDFTGADLTITKARLAVTANSGQRKVYGDADPVLTYTVLGYQGADDNSILTGALNRVVGEDVGAYAIGQGTLSAGANYDIDFTGADFTITKAVLPAFTFNDASFVYDGTVRSLKASGLPAGAIVSYIGNDRTEAGEYTVTANIAGGNNYEDGSQTAKLTITKAVLPAFTFNDASFVYDGTARSLKASGIPAGATVSYIGNDRTETGEYTVTANIAGGNNYEDGSQTAKLTITKAVLPAFTFNDASFVYDGTARSLKASGLPAGATVSYIGNDRTEAGEYTVTANIAGGNNYEDGSQTAKLTITKAVLPAFTFNDASFVYDGTARSLKASGLPAGATVSYIGNDRTEAGEYTVTANIAGGNNYEDGSQTAKLTITKAILPAFTFNDASFVYDGTARSLKASGLPAGTTVSYIGNDRTEAGEYTVTAMINGGNNYEDGSQAAILTIKKAKQVISFSAPEELGRDAGTVLLDAHSDAGLPVSLSVDDPSVATVSNMELYVHRLGTIQITANQAGDANHEAAAAVTVTVRVVAEANAKLPVIVHPALSPNGDGINEFLMIEGIGGVPENKVTIFDKNGSVQAEIIGYNNRDKVFTAKESRDGTYFYYLDLKDNGVWKREKGYFVIRR